MAALLLARGRAHGVSAPLAVAAPVAVAACALLAAAPRAAPTTGRGGAAVRR
ncbi:hypothetical protein [Streptomyces sp. NPDC003090]|uniref:hypothetical protein n=1 Tax=Streptomyces sp. NPDC003090 TaxID=3154274 RepID=UPI00380406DD